VQQRQGDRGSGDDDDSAARRSGLMQSGLPVFYRFKDLVAAGLVNNRTTLLRLIDKQGFPPGTMIGGNTRVWRVTDIETWLASRPTARKVLPPNAGNPRAKRAPLRSHSREKFSAPVGDDHRGRDLRPPRQRRETSKVQERDNVTRRIP
jgi:predicted DNA-binding transcriptional regulator AlpA